jgi:hypothetical protein
MTRKRIVSTLIRTEYSSRTLQISLALIIGIHFSIYLYHKNVCKISKFLVNNWIFDWIQYFILIFLIYSRILKKAIKLILIKKSLRVSIFRFKSQEFCTKK